MRLALWVAMLLTRAAMPAMAQSLPGWLPDAGSDRAPPPADTGKPVILAPPPLSDADRENCLPGLPCGTRLLGTVRKNGAVELQVPALRW